MDEQHTVIAGLDTCVVAAEGHADFLIVLLHGYGMRAADLTPFAHSLGVPGASYAFPQATVPVTGGGFTWWSIPEDERAAKRRQGPRDLAHENPPGRTLARAQIRDLLAALQRETHQRPVLLGGFSQGGMLACDTFLFEEIRVAGLAMMSASRVAIDEWVTRTARLRGMPTFVSHGRDDAELSYGAGLRLREFLESSGAKVAWKSFDGGHEIPFAVWREFRRFAGKTRLFASATTERNVHYGIH